MDPQSVARGIYYQETDTTAFAGLSIERSSSLCIDITFKMHYEKSVEGLHVAIRFTLSQMRN